MAIAPPQGYEQWLADQEKKQKQTAPPTAKRQESAAEIAARSARVREYEADILVKSAVIEHNAKVLAGPRVEKVETTPDEPKKDRSLDEIAADAVDKLNKERQRRGYFAPEKKEK